MRVAREEGFCLHRVFFFCFVLDFLEEGLGYFQMTKKVLVRWRV